MADKDNKKSHILHYNLIKLHIFKAKIFKYFFKYCPSAWKIHLGHNHEIDYKGYKRLFKKNCATKTTAPPPPAWRLNGGNLR